MKMNTKSALMGLSFAAVAAFSASAETTLRYAEGGPNRGTRADAITYFAEQVEELSDGELKVEIHWGGALLKFGAAQSGISVGTADLGSVLAVYAPKQLQAMSIGDLPVGESSDAWVGMRAMYDLMTTNKELQASLAEQNLVYLSNFHTTGIQVECVKGVSVKNLADVQGVKMRASGVYAKIFADAGANIVNMTYGKVYQAFDSGLIECDAGYFYTNRAYKLFEVIDNITKTDFGQVAGFGIVFNQDMWNDLTPDEQKVMRAAGTNMIDYFAELQIDGVDEMVVSLQDGSLGSTITVTDVTPVAKAELVAAAQPYVDGWVAEFTAAGFDGQQVWDQYISLLEKYAQERDAGGYPWTR